MSDPLPTGADLGAALRAAAFERGVSLRTLLGPITNSTSYWLRRLEHTKSIRPRTVACVEALLAGGSVLPSLGRCASPMPTGDFASRRQANGARLLASQAAERARLDALRATDRTPCPRCGVRADVGCTHRPADREVAHV